MLVATSVKEKEKEIHLQLRVKEQARAFKTVIGPKI